MTSLDELRFWIHNQRNAALNMRAKAVLEAIPAMEEIADAVEAGKIKLHEAVEAVKQVLRRSRTT